MFGWERVPRLGEPIGDVRDPLEGLTREGCIRTGARRDRAHESYVPVLDAAAGWVAAEGSAISLYLYGSVATGQAAPPRSDVDLLTIGLDADRAGEIAARLSADFAALCRGVEIGAAMPSDFEGGGDEAYGNRVFLHHYCVHLDGPDRDRATADFPGDRRAARGFNGDIARHAAQWRRDLGRVGPAELGRRVARKTLLAVAGLVSVHDATWSTDREGAARRWAEVEPELADGLAELHEWSDRHPVVDRDRVGHRLTATVDPIVVRFAADIGLWRE